MIVMKFGGSSVADRTQIEKVVEIVRSYRGRSPVVVSSAHKGVTDGLIAAARAAARGERPASDVIAHQRRVADECGCAPELLQPFYDEIRDLLRGIRLVKELSARSLDYISSFGERMSVRVVADLMTRSGLPARAHDVWDLGFITDSNFNRARPLPGYATTMREAFARLPAEEVPVVTGFIGRNEQGEITTVGRNGSDLTATLIGTAVGAEEVQIWSDTDGVMSADPSVVKAARNIPQMRFDEAAELAFFGSRVLHPATLLPAISANIPVRVMNTNRPSHPGTVIAATADEARQVTSIAYKERQTVITVSSPRMFEQAGFLAPIFETAGRHGVVIDVLSTSEVSVSMTTHSSEAVQPFVDELSRFGDVTVRERRSILVVVGRQIATAAGIGAKILTAVAAAGVNVEMISFAMGSINFSMVIDDADIARAVPVLHRVLFEDPAC
jgi:aspartate kinase